MNIYDDTTGLNYLNARYYNPEDGRFITEDTYTGEYSEPSSLHLYAYCQNNPVNNTDPTGNFPWAIVSAAWDAYDGYKIAKKKKLKGWKCVGYVAGYTAVNSLNPFKVVKKAVKVVKSVKKLKKVSKVFKRVKKSKVIAKKIKKVKKVSFKKKHSVKKTTKKKAITATKKRRKGNAPNRAKLNKNKKLCLGNCFTEDTLVLTEDGLVEIDEIEVGDFVWSEDPETGDITLKEVEATFINKTDTLVFINVDGETIKTTEGHLFYVEGIGWIPASMLQEGDSLSLEDGRKVPVQSIKIVDYNYYIFVYNFEVEDFHTYYVSDISVLTHNKCNDDNKKISDEKILSLNNKKMKTNDALDLASNFLENGYSEQSKSRFVSKDGRRVVRLGDSDILGKHAGGPHINFELMKPHPKKVGKMKVKDNIHIFLEDD